MESVDFLASCTSLYSLARRKKKTSPILLKSSARPWPLKDQPMRLPFAERGGAAAEGAALAGHDRVGEGAGGCGEEGDRRRGEGEGDFDRGVEEVVAGGAAEAGDGGDADEET